MNNRSMPPGTIIPELVYADVRAAAAWLCRAFGFKERLRIGSHRIQLVFGEASVVAVDGGGGGAPVAAELAASPSPQGERTHSVMVHVADVDRHYDQAVQSGARILRPPETHPFGERQYTALDLGGHQWTFSQTVADIAPETWGGELVV